MTDSKEINNENVKKLLKIILCDINKGNGLYFVIGYHKQDIPIPLGKFRDVINMANRSKISLVGGFTDKEICFATKEGYLPDRFKINRL